MPDWVPEHFLWLNFREYGDKTLIGAIRFRAQELGAEAKVETALDKAKRLRAVELAESKLHTKLAVEGEGAFEGEWRRLVGLVKEKIAAMREFIQIECARSDATVLIVRMASSTLTFEWVGQLRLSVRYFIGRMLLGAELAGLPVIPGIGPQEHSGSVFQIEYNAAWGWCWRNDGEAQTTETLADKSLQDFLEMNSKVESGEIRKRSPRPAQTLRRPPRRGVWS
jgi:hypothetical protein